MPRVSRVGDHPRCGNRSAPASAQFGPAFVADWTAEVFPVSLTLDFILILLCIAGLAVCREINRSRRR